MADERRYTLDIYVHDSEDEQQAIGKAPDGITPGGSAAGGSVGGGGGNKNPLGKLASSAASSFVNTAVSTWSADVATLSGSTQLQQRQALVSSVAGSASNIAISAVSAGSLAAALGMSAASGGVIGLAIGAATTAISSLTSIIQKANDIQNKAQIETYSLDVARNRMGIAYSGSRR